MLGHDPNDLPFRHALRYNQHSEDLWETRIAFISKAIGNALG